MQSILCDVCEGEIRETAQELIRVTGMVASAMDAGVRIVNRQTMSVHIVCPGCADWLFGAQVYLGDHLAAAAQRRTPAAQSPEMERMS